MVYRIHKDSNYTTISNYHLNDKNLSFKAKGLLTFMLSVGSDWVFLEEGFAKCSTDGVDRIRSGLHELEEHGYLIRTRERDDKGHYRNAIYDIYETPQKQRKEPNPNSLNYQKPNWNNPNWGKRPLPNTKLTKRLIKPNTKVYTTATDENEDFPSEKEIKKFCKSEHLLMDCEKFKAYYDIREWRYKDGVRINNWRALARYWAASERHPERFKACSASFDIEEIERALRESEDIL